MPCYFQSPISGYSIPSTSKIKCGGDRTLLNTIYSFKPELYGCANTIDLLLLRGRGEEIDWNDVAQVARIEAQKICENHLKDLIIEWNEFPANNTSHIKQYKCSLFAVDHIQTDKRKKVVKTKTRMRKNDALIYTRAFHKICHPGTCSAYNSSACMNRLIAVICSHHLHLLRNGEFDKFVFTAEGSTEDSTEEPNDESTSSENEIMHIIESDEVSVRDDSSIYLPHPDDYFDIESSLDDNMSMYSLNANAVTSPTLDSSKDETEKHSSLRRIASLFGLSRLTSDRDWNTLLPDTQRKKIAAMIHLQNELYKICAGSNWEAMKHACIKKIGQIADCSRVTQILQSIEERIEQTTDRRSKLSLVSVLTGHFTEKEIVHATGVTRYYIREAKKFALCGLNEVKNVTRMRYNHPNVKMFVSFISRPEIIVWLPKSARSLKLSSGDSITMASVARLHSYRYIFTMFQSFLEMQGISECEVTGGDVNEFVRAHGLSYSLCVKLMETSVLCVTELKETLRNVKKRGRPPKKIASVVPGANNSREDENKGDKSGSPTSERVLRSRKRPYQKKEIDYCELSSDEELDDYTVMMNALLEQETSDEEC